MSKNVSRDRVKDLNKKLFDLQKAKMQENDLEHFKRFERFIEQESLSDQRFSVYGKYKLSIPENYTMVNSVSAYNEFIQKWNPAERNSVTIKSGHTAEYEADFSDSDFLSPEQLIVGKTYEITEYRIRETVPTLDCLRFLNNEGADVYGLQAIYTLLDLDKDKVTFKSNGVVSIDPTNLLNKNAIFFTQRSGNLVKVQSSHKGRLTSGDILLSLKQLIDK